MSDFNHTSEAIVAEKKPSILEEAIESVMARKRSSVGLEGSAEWRKPGIYSSTSTASNSSQCSPSASVQGSRKNSTGEDTDIIKPHLEKIRQKARYNFFSINLVERQIIQPGANCLPFPWTSSQSLKAKR